MPAEAAFVGGPPTTCAQAELLNLGCCRNSRWLMASDQPVDLSHGPCPPFLGCSTQDSI